VPNSARLVGGAGTDSSSIRYEKDQPQTDGTMQWNSVVICTGANACGKVDSHGSLTTRWSLILSVECLFEAGTWIHLWQ
jgi:hypothetical protein